MVERHPFRLQNAVRGSRHLRTLHMQFPNSTLKRGACLTSLCGMTKDVICPLSLLKVHINFASPCYVISIYISCRNAMRFENAADDPVRLIALYCHDRCGEDRK